MPELPTPGTIKRRLFDDLLAHPDLTPEELAKRHGLNGHDLVKNLEQLRQHGFIDVKMKDEHIVSARIRNGAANMAMLERPKAAISLDQSEHAAKLAGPISKLPWLNEEWRVWELEESARLSGLKPGQIGDAMRQLREQGRLQQLGGGGRGKRIQGVRWKGERRPAGSLLPAPAVSATPQPEAPSRPPQELRRPILAMPGNAAVQQCEWYGEQRTVKVHLWGPIQVGEDSQASLLWKVRKCLVCGTLDEALLMQQYETMREVQQ